MSIPEMFALPPEMLDGFIFGEALGEQWKQQQYELNWYSAIAGAGSLGSIDWHNVQPLEEDERLGSEPGYAESLTPFLY